MAAFRSSHADALWIPAEDGVLRLPNELFIPNMPWTTQNPEGYQRVHKDIPEGLDLRNPKAPPFTPIKCQRCSANLNPAILVDVFLQCSCFLSLHRLRPEEKLQAPLSELVLQVMPETSGSNPAVCYCCVC